MGFRTLASNEQIDNAVVVDNSVMMRWLFQDGSQSDQAYAQQVLQSIKTDRPEVIVPYLWVYESAFVVSFYLKKNNITDEQGINHLASLFSLCNVIRGEETPGALFEFSKTHQLSSYDSAYVLLATQHSCPIATLDIAMLNTAKMLDIHNYIGSKIK